MSKQPISPSQNIEADHELQRLRGLAGFHAFERQVEISLEQLTQRWADWGVRGCSDQTINRNLCAIR